MTKSNQNTISTIANNLPLFTQFLNALEFKIELNGSVIESTFENLDAKETKIKKNLGAETTAQMIIIDSVEYNEIPENEKEQYILTHLLKARSNCVKSVFTSFAGKNKGFTLSRGLTKLIKGNSKLDQVSYSCKVNELKVSFKKLGEDQFTLLKLKSMTESFRLSLGL